MNALQLVTALISGTMSDEMHTTNEDSLCPYMRDHAKLK
jgi:hypothetical protein